MRIGFVTHMSPQSCPTERLWVAAAQHLRHEFGAEIGISIASHPKEDSDAWDKVQPIASAFGERKHEEGTLANRIRNRLDPSFAAFDVGRQLEFWLEDFCPDLVYISQGGNLDGHPTRGPQAT